MTPASFSNSDIASTNPAAPTSTSDSSMTSRAHLYPMTNIDQDRGYTGWDRQNYPYSVKPWTASEGESASYDYSCDKDSPSGPSEQHRSQPPDRMDPSVCAAPRPSFPTTPSTYGLLSGLNGLTDLSSPIQSHDDAQWQMYLTSSLSNPLESLPFSSVRSPPSLSYPSEPVEGIMVHIPEPPPAMDQFSIPDDATFGGLMITGSDKVHQSAFASSPSRLSSEFPYSRVHVDYIQSDIYRESDQGLPQRPAETTTNGVYASFMDTSSSSFTLPSTEFTSSNVAPHLVSNLTLAPSSTSTTLQDRYPILSHPSPIRPRRGLCGWNGPQSPEEPIDRAFTANVHGKRLRSVSPSPILTYRRPQSAKTTPSGGQISLARETQRSRNSNAHSLSKKSALSNRPHEFDPDSDDDGNDDGDSDDYRPSRSASPDSAFPSSYPVQFLCETGTESSGPSKKKAKRGKGKAKGSAALALAVVTQLGGTKSQDGSEQFDDDFDPLTVYSEGRHGIRKRKNHPIPLPVPIPNLNKKSRGRKVPFVADLTSSGGSTSPPANVLDDDEEPIRGSGPGRIRRKTSRMPTPVQDELAGSRSYVCVVPGCGKCFVRGEHLKRHVRSIHTHDKPHPCPYKGCDKSFSRRDNLGQHVRIHLQP